MRTLYSENYFRERQDYFFEDGLINDASRPSAHIRDFENGLELLESYKPPPGRLLDVGCAVGSFLYLAGQRQWQCYGVEVSEFAAAIARDRLGVPVFTGRFIDAPYPAGHFDVITMWDILEHLPNPIAALQKSHRLLNSCGILLLNVPNEKSLLRMAARMIYQGSGGLIKGPVNRLYHQYHLNYFNRDSLSFLIKKSGFEILSVTQKVMPLTRGRGGAWVKAVRKCLSLLENMLHCQYELFCIVQKKD